ncbi:MAG: LacI family transcriptional regulator, partial [Epulopiscium sp.]|nr:LacI family transcriptional regulator [Candidatus Epulonipiscium sp.]
VNYLIKKGYTKIAYIAGPLNTRTARDRLDGYKKALVENNLRYEENLVMVGEYKAQWGSEAALSLLESEQDFQAIFCGNDLIAIGAMKKLREKKVTIPDDVAVMGFDDIYISSLVDPELTTIKQPNYKMGFEAVRIMIDYLEGKEIEEKNIILSTELIIRKSS